METVIPMSKCDTGKGLSFHFSCKCLFLQKSFLRITDTVVVSVPYKEMSCIYLLSCGILHKYILNTFRYQNKLIYVLPFVLRVFFVAELVTAIGHTLSLYFYVMAGKLLCLLFVILLDM